jgi:guanine nucleotide-binding protein G(i) subunit alpha
MGACMSSGGNDEGDQKKRSQMIDRGLEEDSKKLRRECKILLLGKGDAPVRMWHARCMRRTHSDVELY